jgi:hypothetical protein
MATKSTDLKSALGQLEGTLETYLVDKAPFSIPAEWKELIVKFAPYLTLVGVVVSVLGILSAVGLTSMMSPFAYFGALHLGFWFYLMLAYTVVVVILEGLAVKPLFSKDIKGWQFIYYAALVNALYSVVTFSFGGLIGVVISLYFIFQVKSYYK